jgi:hypothetical protein
MAKMVTRCPKGVPEELLEGVEPRPRASNSRRSTTAGRRSCYRVWDMTARRMLLMRVE